MTTTDTSHTAYVLHAAEVALNNLRVALTGEGESEDLLPEWEWVLLNGKTVEPVETFRTIEAGYLGEDDDEWDESHGTIVPEKLEGYVGSWLLAITNRYGSASITRSAGANHGWVSFRARTSDGHILGSLNVFGNGVARIV